MATPHKDRAAFTVTVVRGAQTATVGAAGSATAGQIVIDVGEDFDTKADIIRTLEVAIKKLRSDAVAITEDTDP